MTHTDLKAIQESLKFDAKTMSILLGIDYEQYRRYLYGTAAITETVARAAQELVNIEREFDIARDAEYCKFLDQHYPQGVISEVIDMES